MSTNKAHSTCDLCSTNIEVTKSQLTAKLPKYCSDCYKVRFEHTCVICNTKFRNGRHQTKTCSHDCRWGLNRSKKTSTPCYRCGTIVTRPSFTIASNKRVFCSERCNNAQYSNENPNRYGSDWYAKRKETLQRDNYTCKLCNSTENLEVHHIVKLTTFNSTDEANVLSNLTTLCKSCHKTQD